MDSAKKYRLVLQLRRYVDSGDVWIDDVASTDTFDTEQAAIKWWKSVRRDWALNDSAWKSRAVVKMDSQISPCRDQHWIVKGDAAKGEVETREKQIWFSILYGEVYACAIPLCKLRDLAILGGDPSL